MGATRLDNGRQIIYDKGKLCCSRMAAFTVEFDVGYAGRLPW